MKPVFKVLSPLLLLSFGTSVYSIQTEIDRLRGRHHLMEELMYFPSGRFVKQAVLGYDHLAADLVWLRAVQYFGQHRMTDLKFEYLGHILDILTTLDPQFIHAYTFGALLLTHAAKEPDRAMELLQKGMRENPSDWRLPYITGFIHYVFLRDLRKAGEYFLKASRLPRASEKCLRFASFVYERAGEREVALRLWTELYNSTQNEIEKETALRYIKKLIMQGHIESMEKAIEEYRRVQGTHPSTLEQLVTGGFLKEIPEEPHGGRYYLDTKTHQVRSTVRSVRLGVP